MDQISFTGTPLSEEEEFATPEKGMVSLYSIPLSIEPWS
jgi:hypothetical protein